MSKFYSIKILICARIHNFVHFVSLFLLDPVEEVKEVPKDREETDEEKKRREARLKAMESRLTNKSKIDDRGVQAAKTSPYKSSEGRQERMLEGRARALLGKNKNIEDAIRQKEKEEKEMQDRHKQELDELALHRTESQKTRANKVDLLGNFF
jgi:hypothetical protein